MVVTSENLYNIKGECVKRRIPIANLAGITKSMIGPKNEITMHVTQDYDYRYISDRR